MAQYLHEMKELERGTVLLTEFLPTILRNWFHVPRAKLFNFTVVPSDSPN